MTQTGLYPVEELRIYLARFGAKLPHTLVFTGLVTLAQIRFTELVAKTIAVARKSYLFSDTPSGAPASARLFSIIETAQANSHNPHYYLTVLLAELPNASTVEQIEALLPWNLALAEVRRRFEALLRP